MDKKTLLILVVSVLMSAILIALGYMMLPDCDDGTIVRGVFWYECIK